MKKTFKVQNSCQEIYVFGVFFMFCHILFVSLYWIRVQSIFAIFVRRFITADFQIFVFSIFYSIFISVFVASFIYFLLSLFVCFSADDERSDICYTPPLHRLFFLFIYFFLSISAAFLAPYEVRWALRFNMPFGTNGIGAWYSSCITHRI